MKQKIVIVLSALVLLIACREQPKLAPLAIDLPASYKTDTIAYNFIMRQVDAWNKFGVDLDKMYKKGEEYRKKDFSKLSDNEKAKLVKLDLDYATYWMLIDLYITKMTTEATSILRLVTPQGLGKVKETQTVIAGYYLRLSETYGRDLQLDKEPYTLSPQEDSLLRVKMDAMNKASRDSIAKDTLNPQGYLDTLRKDSLKRKK